MTLLEALKKLQQDGPYNERDGICHNLEYLMYGEDGRDPFDEDQPDPCELLAPQFESWDEYSGNEAYPIALEGWMRPSSAYWSSENSNKWVGEYGEVRKRLLQHCITELESV